MSSGSFIGGIILLITSLVVGEFRYFHLNHVSPESWIGLLYLIFIGALVGFSAYIWLLSNAPLSLTSTYAYVNPVVAVLLGCIFLDEQMTVQVLCGGATILCGVLLMTRR